MRTHQDMWHALCLSTIKHVLVLINLEIFLFYVFLMALMIPMHLLPLLPRRLLLQRLNKCYGIEIHSKVNILLLVCFYDVIHVADFDLRIIYFFLFFYFFRCIYETSSIKSISCWWCSDYNAKDIHGCRCCGSVIVWNCSWCSRCFDSIVDKKWCGTYFYDLWSPFFFFELNEPFGRDLF